MINLKQVMYSYVLQKEGKVQVLQVGQMINSAYMFTKVSTFRKLTQSDWDA